MLFLICTRGGVVKSSEAGVGAIESQNCDLVE